MLDYSPLCGCSSSNYFVCIKLCLQGLILHSLHTQHLLKLMEIQKTGLRLVLVSTKLSPNSASGVGSAVLNPEDWRLSTIFSV